MKERNVFSEEKISKFLKIIEEKCPKSASDYYVLNKFAVFRNELGEQFLIDKKDITLNTPPIFVSTDCVNDYLKNAHDRVFHGGIKKTYRASKQNVKNVKMKQVNDFISQCTYCQKIKKEKKDFNKLRNRVTRPIVSREYGSRGQADLIDVRVFGTKNCSFILNYQDNLTRFCVLRPLVDKSSMSVLRNLIEIFNLLGAPRCLHTDNGGEFRGKELTSTLKKYWPELTLIRGKPYNPRSQGAVERCNQDVKRMLLVYIDQQTDGNYDFGRALSVIQFAKNTSFNRTIQCSPYKALFGQEPVVDLKSEHFLRPISDDNYEKNQDKETVLDQRQEFIETRRCETFKNTVHAAKKMMIT